MVKLTAPATGTVVETDEGSAAALEARGFTRVKGNAAAKKPARGSTKKQTKEE